MTPLTAMVSYQSADRSASVLLRDELALRGMAVVRDGDTFLGGNHVVTEMEAAVRTSDAMVAYITPDYLYEGRDTDEPRPALDREFIPFMRRRDHAVAAASAVGVADPRTVRPVLYPVVQGLGRPHSDAANRIRRATGYDISGLWAPAVDEDGPLTQADAARVARDVLRRLLPPGIASGTTHGVSLLTRGGTVPAEHLCIDATPLLGGSSNRVGCLADWLRLQAALLDVRSVLSEHGQGRRLELFIKGHISAGILFGRVFNQAAGWELRVPCRHGAASTSGLADSGDAGLTAHWVPGSDASRWMSVEIDLLGNGVSEVAELRHRTTATAPRGRLRIVRSEPHRDITAEEVSNMARVAARHVRTHVVAEHATTISIACASPVEFAVLLGHRLTGLYAEIELLERGDEGYEPVLAVPAAT